MQLANLLQRGEWGLTLYKGRGELKKKMEIGSTTF